MGDDRRSQAADDTGARLCRAAGSNVRRPRHRRDRMALSRLRRVPTAQGAERPFVLDAHGGVYFTDLGKRWPRGHGSRRAVYYAKLDGSVITEHRPTAGDRERDRPVARRRQNTLRRRKTEAARLLVVQDRGAGNRQQGGLSAPHGGHLVAGMGGFTASISIADPTSRPARHLRRRDPRQRRRHRHLARRTARRAPQDARPDDDEYLLPGGSDMRTAYITLSGTGSSLVEEEPSGGVSAGLRQEPGRVGGGADAGASASRCSLLRSRILP